MTALRYLLRSVLFHRFAYAGVCAGAALGAMVLLGALFAGDSVKRSLRIISEQRTGHATHLLTAGDRFFRDALADDLARTTGVRAAPLLYTHGTATHATTQAAASQVQLVGVTNAFWQLAPRPAAIALNATSASVAVNEALARRLNVGVGDTLVVRLQRPGALAGNAPVAGAASSLASLRCRVAALAGDDAFGRFSLEASQIARPSVFLPIALLQEHLERPGGANVLLIDTMDSQADLAVALARAVTLADYGLSLTWLASAEVFEVTSDRIFIDPEVAAALRKAIPEAQPVLSYLVNEFRFGDRTTPYSIATATTHEAAPFLPADLQAGEIVLNSWLAEDLQATPGDEVRLSFFQADDGSTLVERSATLTVRSVAPLAGLAADSAWMPDFPGISEAENAADWDPGLPLDLSRIRDQDERYWDNHRGAPKAFLSYPGGVDLWSTRWGDCTALRLPAERGLEGEIAVRLLGALQPEMNQLIVRAFGAAQGAASPAVDFGGLFIGMSFFLILASLGLVAMLFQFCLLERQREDALLGAVGLRPGRLVRWRLAEAGAVLVAGCLVGAPLAVLYTRGILRFLESIWAAQSSGPTFVFAAAPESFAGGLGAFLLLSLLAVWLAIRRQTRRALSVRLSAGGEEIASSASRRIPLVIAISASAVALMAVALSGRVMSAQGAFYVAGFALLIAGLALCRWWMAGVGRQTASASLDASRLGKLNLAARRARSLTVVALIATAVFMVLSVASFRKHVGADWLERSSGTGGFAFWVETTAAQNPAREGDGAAFEIFEPVAGDLGAIVPLRTGAGDNVNCFNLNTTTQPQLLAVDARALDERDAFSLQMAAEENLDTGGWSRSREARDDGFLPALVDKTTLQWALKRQVGDVLHYRDENGRELDVQIVGTIADSIFQGYLIVDEQLFLARFPSSPGYSRFLVEARDPTGIEALRERFATAVASVGGRVDLTRDILAAFHGIENTYIAIFNVLGTLGVILGSLGLAIVVARNLRERRGEFALLTAVGIPRRVLSRLVFAEFGRLVLWGTGIGVIAAAIAVWPNLAALPPAPTLLLVMGLLAGIAGLNLVCGRLVFTRTVGHTHLALDEIVR